VDLTVVFFGEDVAIFQIFPSHFSKMQIIKILFFCPISRCIYTQAASLEHPPGLKSGIYRIRFSKF